MTVISLQTVSETPRVVLEYGLMSDLHLEAATTDRRAIERDLEAHAEAGRMVFINGDVFDAILPKDIKRYARGAHKQSTSDEVINEAVADALELFLPFGSAIKGIGFGNHEEAVVKHGGVNPCKWLVDLMRDKGHDVAYMGWTGAIVHSVVYAPNGKRSGSTSFITHYHHGSGGTERVSKGMNALYHFGAWSPDADVLWLGHKHDLTANKACYMRIGSTGAITSHIQARVQSAAYQRPFDMSYARVKNLPPQPMGSAVARFETFRTAGSSVQKRVTVTI